MDIDGAKYFGTVNHDLLIGMVREQVEDEAVIHLIRKYLTNKLKKGVDI